MNLQDQATTSQFAVLAYNADGMPDASKGQTIPAGWERIPDNLGGKMVSGPFAAFAYRNTNTNQIIIAYRGTDGASDMFANTGIATGTWSTQFDSAAVFANGIYLANPGASIAVTGHSLGGTMAGIVSQMFGFDGVALDPGAASRLVQTSGFQNAASNYVGSSNGLGMPSSFTNFVGNGSVVSGSTGAQLGTVVPLPGGDGNLWGGALGLLNPALGVLGLIGSVQIGIHKAEAYQEQISLLQAVSTKLPGGLQGRQFTATQIATDPNDQGQPTQIRSVMKITNPATGDVEGYLYYGNEGTLTVYSGTGSGQPTIRAYSADGIYFAADLGGTTSGTTTNTFSSTITDPSTISTTGGTDPTTSVSANTSTVLSTGVYTVNGVGDVNNASGNTALANYILTGDFSPGRYSIVDGTINSTLNQLYPVAPNLNLGSDIQMALSGAVINLGNSATQVTLPTDPLVLDLNGDGVKLTSYADAPVLFDINHDGPSAGSGQATKELTGWVSAQDGIVVYDLNGNGKIDDISETMSEYFNGAVGTGGNAGTKPFANGFAALKSLDSNGDNQFTSADAAWNNVNVWVDANHDGVTDAGELKTLASLGITSINLASTAQSGLVSGGNEILASGTFTMNGTTQAAQAASLIANPTGNTITTSATGSTVSAADGQSTYVSSVTTGESIDVALKSVKNAYGNAGSDTLTGDAGNNWLAGNGGSDTFNAGAGDDVLLIDAADLQANIHAGAGFDMVQVVGADGVTLNMAQAEVEVAIGGVGNDVFIGGGRSNTMRNEASNNAVFEKRNAA